MLEIITLPVLADNYIYLIHDTVANETAAVDPALAKPVLNALDDHQWRLTAIFNTHHHSDHIGGNLELKRQTGCTIFAGEYDRNRIPGLDHALQEGDIVRLGNHQAQVLFIPGHTLGHIAYYFAEDGILFCGDTLFVMGCGRLFEGTAEQMWQSLQKLKVLPTATKVYCTHEYTLSNGRFALTVEPNNPFLQQRMIQVNQLRSNNQPTVPSTIGAELETNPFLRDNSPSLQKTIGMLNHKPVEIFAKVRRLKDSFS